MTTSSTLGLSVELHTDFDTALTRTIDALKTEGFGVLTEIDVKDTLNKKLNVDFRPYKILGACNPPLAYRALTAAPEVGLLLPCNVTVAQLENGHVQVSAVDPLMMMSVVPNQQLQSIAHEARERLSRALHTLEV